MAPTHRKKIVVAPLNEEELDAVTIVFHQFETGLREGTIYTMVFIFILFDQYNNMNYTINSECSKTQRRSVHYFLAFFQIILARMN